MKSSAIFLFLMILASVPATYAQGQGGRGGGQPQPPLVETTATAIPGVIAAGTRVTPIKDGFQGTEGPITLPDGSLIFTETAANRITRIDKDNNITTFLENTNGSNALGFDAKGRLITVQTVQGNTKVGAIQPAVEVLADSFDGKPFSRPNDLVVSRTGGVYFSDMPQGNAPPALPAAVYYIPPGGKVVRAADGIQRPNGVQLSPDEKTLYVNDVSGEYMLAFDIGANGALSNRRNFAKYEGVAPPIAPAAFTSQADGIAVDNAGRVYCAMPNGVQVFDSTGKYLGLIPTSRRVQNLAFAGADKKTLYMVGSGSAWKTQMIAEGFKGRAK